MGEDKAKPQGDDGVCIKVTTADGCPAATPPPRTTRETLQLCCAWCCFFLAIISLGIMIFHTSSAPKMDNMKSPRFQVESVSVSLERDNVAFAHDLFRVTAKWNISFSVQNRTSTFDYDNFNVRVVCLSDQGSSAAVLQHHTNNNTTVLNATANTSLHPKDFARLVQGLEFDVVLRAQAGKHMHEASCEGMRVEFPPWSLTKGTLVGGPKSCQLPH